MAPNSRVCKAFNAMKALGISSEEVKPVLMHLLKVYNGNWDLIEDDNYRTLIDAYFEFKEDKGAEGNRKAPISCHDGEKPKQKIDFVADDDGDDDKQIFSSMNNSSKMLSVKDNKIPQKTFEQETNEQTQTFAEDVKPRSSSQASHLRLSEVEKISNSLCKVSKDRKSHPEKASSAGHCDLYEKELVKPGTKKPKLQFQPLSTNCSGSSEVSSGNHRVKTLSTQLQEHRKVDGSESNNTITFKRNINIASSPHGEIKLYLNCASALGQPNFCIPNLDAVMKFMEEKYRKSCKNSVRQFSMVKLLDDLCRSYLKVGMNLNRKGSSWKYQNSNNLSCLQLAATQDESKPFHFISDITKGSEKIKISVVDEIGGEDLPKFNYIPHNVIYQGANVNISLARISDEGCCSDCSGDCISLPFPCACAQETGGEFAYTLQGLLKEDFLTACMSMKDEPQDHHFVYCRECPLEKIKNEYIVEQCKGHLIRKFIKECWRKCGCEMRCGNRVVQRGIRCKLQVFLTREGKGWGLRTLEDLPKGTFVCEYAGEILTNTELYERIQKSGNDRHTYPVTLDADWGSEGVLKDEEALCLDATYNGNVGRFINHRCSDANLVDIPVEVETPDHHYYHLAFFTKRKVSAYEELTWDYGIDFDDHDHPIKAFQCCCGSPFCRVKKQKGKRKI